MARPANKDILARYRAELQRSIKWREHEQYDQLWDRMVDMYRGRQYQRYVDEDRLVVNIAKATIDVINPSISVNNPKILVNARLEENADSAVIAEAVINYHWRYGKFQKQIRRAVNDMLMVGHGWVKIGYSYSEEPHEAVASEDELSRDTVPAEESAHTPDMEHAPEEHPTAETLTPRRVDRPFVERVSFRDIFVDPDASDTSELRWICQRIRRPVADVKRDKRYTAEGRKAAQAETKDRWDRTDPRWNQNTGSVPGGYVDVYEFYDLMNSKVCTFTKSGEDHFLIAPKVIPLPFPNPFVMFRDYEVPDLFYPMGELEAIEVLQHELNECRTTQMLHRRQYNPKYLYRESVFPDEEHVQALRDDAYNSMVPVADENLPQLDDAVVRMPTETPPPELYNMSQQAIEDMRTITGVTDYMQGQMPDIRRTATEAGIIADQAQARAEDKLGRVENTSSEIAERVLQTLQAFTTGDQVALITGMNGIKVWMHYDRDDIQGEFLYEVEAGSTQPINESFRRQSALQMMDALTPLLEMGVVDPAGLAQYVIQNGFGVKNAAHLVQPPPPPDMPAEGMGEPMIPGEAGMSPEMGMGGPPPDALPPGYAA